MGSPATTTTQSGAWAPNPMALGLDIQGRILPANLNFSLRGPSPFLQGTSSRMTAELPWCFSHTRPSASWAVAVAGRVGGVASARGCCCWRPTPHPHHACVDVARDSPVDGARAPPSSFCISLRPGMCQGERAGGPCNFSLLFALLSSLFSLFSNLCHICGSPPAPPDRTRFPGLLRLFALLLPAGTRALPASVSHIHGPGSALSGKRKYKSTKLSNWSPGGFCCSPCPLSLRDLSQHHSPKQPTTTTTPQNPSPTHSPTTHRAVEGQPPRKSRPHESLEVTRARRAPIPS